MSDTMHVKVFYELIVEDEFEFETSGDVPMVDIVAQLLANERLRSLQVVDTTGKTYEVSEARRFVKEIGMYADSDCQCDECEEKLGF